MRASARPTTRLAVAVLAVVIAPSCRARRLEPPYRIDISVPYEVDSLDPHARNSLTNFAIASHLYEPLISTDSDMKLQPCLARLWENPDPSTWVFHLQPNVRFHSGRPLRAADVVYSIRRLMGSQSLQMAGYVLYIADVRAVDLLTVRLRSTRPLSVLLNKLRFVSIVPEGSTPESLAANPDGTGPYRFQRWTPGRSIEIARNEGYWGRRPALREVVIQLDRTPEQALDDLVSGRAGLVQLNAKTVATQAAALGRYELQRRPSLFVKYLSYDFSREATPFVNVRPNPFRDHRVREALHLALDRQAIVDALSTEAIPANQLVPPVIFGFNPALPAPTLDRARARTLLAEAGCKDGFRATLHVRKIYAEAARLVSAQLREIGLALEPEVLGDREALDLLGRHEASLYLSRFGCPTGDASDILDNALHTIDAAHHMGIGNYGGYSNAAVDRAIEESAGVEGVNERRELLQDIMARLMDDLVWIPLYVDQDVYALDRRFAWTPRNDSFILAAEVELRH